MASTAFNSTTTVSSTRRSIRYPHSGVYLCTKSVIRVTLDTEPISDPIHDINILYNTDPSSPNPNNRRTSIAAPTMLPVIVFYPSVLSFADKNQAYSFYLPSLFFLCISVVNIFYLCSQGIMLRSFLPTSSIICSSPMRLRALYTGRPAWFSRIHSRANSPD